MTEKKRFVNENDGDIRDTSTMIKYYCLSLTGKELCDLLNEQDKEIKRLKKENQGLQFKIIDMLDFVKEKGTVTREEIKKWWNGDVE